MRDDKKRLKLPTQLLVLDAIGCILLGLGLAEWIANTNLVPEPLQFNNYYMAMVVIGVLLMLPALVFFLKHALGRLPREI